MATVQKFGAVSVALIINRGIFVTLQTFLVSTWERFYAVNLAGKLCRINMTWHLLFVTTLGDFLCHFDNAFGTVARKVTTPLALVFIRTSIETRFNTFTLQVV